MGSDIRVLAIAALEVGGNERPDVHIFSLRRKARVVAKNNDLSIDDDSFNDSLKRECSKLVDQGWLTYTKLRYKPTKPLLDFIQHQRNALYIPDGQKQIDTFRAIVNAMPPSAKDAISVNSQGRRRTRQSLAAVEVPSRAESEVIDDAELARAVASNKKRRTRHTEPVVRLVQPERRRSSGVRKSTGSSSRSNRRHTIAANSHSLPLRVPSTISTTNNAATVSTERQFLPLGQVLSSRARRALRRNGLSEEQGELEQEERLSRRRNKEELERVKRLLSESNSRLSELQQQLEMIRSAPSEVASLGMAPIYEDDGERAPFTREPSVGRMSEPAAAFRRRITMSPGLLAARNRLLNTPAQNRRDQRIQALESQIQALEKAIREHELEEQRMEEFDIFHDAEEGTYTDFASPRHSNDFHHHDEIVNFGPAQLDTPKAATAYRDEASSPAPMDAPQDYSDNSSFGEPMHVEGDEPLSQGPTLVSAGSQTVEDEHVLAKLRDANSQIEELEKKLEIREAQFEASARDMESLKEQLAQMAQEKDDAAQDYEAQLEELREKSESAAEEANNMKKASETLVIELKKQIEELYKVVEDLKAKKELEVQEKLAEIEALRIDATSEKDKLQIMVEELETRSEDFEEQIESLTNQLESAKADVARLEEVVEDKESELIDLRNENSDLDNKLEELREQFAASEQDWREQRDRLSGEIEDLKEDLEDAVAERDELIDTLRENKEKLADAESTNNELTVRLEASAAALAKTQTELSEALCQVGDVDLRYSSLKDEHSASEQTAAVFQNLVDDLQAQLESETVYTKKTQKKLDDAVARIDILLAQRRKDEAKLAELTSTIKSKDSEIQHLSSALIPLEAQYAELKVKQEQLVETFKEEKDTLLAQLLSKDDAYKILDVTKAKQLEVANARIAEVEGKVSQLKDELRATGDALDQEQTRSAELDEQLHNLQEITQGLRENVFQLESKNKDLQQEVQQATTRIANITEKNNEFVHSLAEAEVKVEELIATLEEKEREVVGLETQKEELRKSGDDLRAEFAESSAALTNTIEELNRILSEKQSLVTGLQSEVQELTSRLSAVTEEAELKRVSLEEEHERTVTNNKQEIERLLSDLTRARGDIAELDSSSALLRTELNTVKNVRDTLQSAKSDLEEKLRHAKLSLVDALGAQAKAEQEYELALEELRNELNDVEEEIQTRTAEHQTEIERIRAAFAEDVAAIKKTYEETISQLRNEHSKAMDLTLRNAAEDRSNLERSYQQERLQAQAVLEETIAELKEAHEVELARVIRKFKDEATSGISEMMRKLGQAMLDEARMDVGKAAEREGGPANKRARIDDEDEDLSGGVDVWTPPSSLAAVGDANLLEVGRRKKKGRRAYDSGIGVEE